MQTRPLCAPVLRSWAKHGMRLVPWPEAGRTVPWAGPYGKLYFALVFVQGMSLGQVCRNYDISNWPSRNVCRSDINSAVHLQGMSLSLIGPSLECLQDYMIARFC